MQSKLYHPLGLMKVERTVKTNVAKVNVSELANNLLLFVIKACNKIQALLWYHNEFMSFVMSETPKCLLWRSSSEQFFCECLPVHIREQ